jgi:hypothetical protein
MKTTASRLLLGAVLLVVAGLVLGFASEGSARVHRSYADAETLLAQAGMEHVRGVSHPSRHAIVSLPLALRGCAVWLRGASLDGYINALVCDSHTSALEAQAYIVKTGHLGGSGLETAINDNLFCIVIAPTQRAADRLTSAVSGT